MIEIDISWGIGIGFQLRMDGSGNDAIGVTI